MNFLFSPNIESLDSRTAIALFRAYEFAIPAPQVKKGVSVRKVKDESLVLYLDKYVQKWIQEFDPKSLATQILLRRDDEDCVGMIEAYMEYHAGTNIHNFLAEIEGLDKAYPGAGEDLKYRVGKAILKEADKRGVEAERLECFVQAFLDIYDRKCLSGINVRLRYICLSIYSILSPLVSASVTTSLKSTIGDGGFLFAASTPPRQLQHMALEWGRYMRMQIQRWIDLREQNIGVSARSRLRAQEGSWWGEEKAYREGVKVFDLIWDELARGVVYGNHLHRLVWNLGWEMEMMGWFWSEVLSGFNEGIEDENGLAEQPRTSWFAYIK